MKFRFLAYLLLLTYCTIGYSQNIIDIKAKFDVENKLITISQTISYKNTSKDTLKTIYLNDWSNSYASKKTDLAIRLADEYINRFHLANDEQRGYTEMTSILHGKDSLTYTRLKNQIDVIKINMLQPILPDQSYSIKLNYIVKIPSSEFTSYGYTKENDFNLRYWYITPAIYNYDWQYYSNKNINDLFKPKSDIKLELTYPKNYKLTSELNIIESLQNTDHTTTILHGKDRINSKLYLSKNSKFKSIKNDNIEIVSDLF